MPINGNTYDWESVIHITKTDTGPKQGEEKVEVKCDFTILSPIKWGGVAAYDDAGAVGE